MKTNHHSKTSVLTGLFILLVAASTLAQQMNYQGRLTDASGNAVGDAQYSITFDIYDAATSGTKTWGTSNHPRRHRARPFQCHSWPDGYRRQQHRQRL